jgi:hypothetical protein
LEDKSWQLESLTGKGIETAYARVNLLFLVGFWISDEGGAVVDEDDDDGWEPIKLVTGPCDSNSGYSQKNDQDSV